MSIKELAIAIISSCLIVCTGVTSTLIAAPAKRYLSYEMFKSLTATCPEIKSPVLAGLTPGGQDMWSIGQMRMPAETHLFEGDFNHDGIAEAALVITSGGKNYLLVAERAASSWRRCGLVAIAGREVRQFNGRAFVLDEKSFVAWDGKRYRLEGGPLAIYCNAYEVSEFSGVSCKLTYVGPQDEPYPGLMISTYYRWPDLTKFKTYRKSGVSYGNDDMQVMWHLTLPPEDLRQAAVLLGRSKFVDAAEDRKGTAAGVLHSLSMLDEHSSKRPNFYEVFLKGSETVELLNALSQKIETNNADGAKLLKEYAKMFGN